MGNIVTKTMNAVLMLSSACEQFGKRTTIWLMPYTSVSFYLQGSSFGWLWKTYAALQITYKTRKSKLNPNYNLLHRVRPALLCGELCSLDWTAFPLDPYGIAMIVSGIGQTLRGSKGNKATACEERSKTCKKNKKTTHLWSNVFFLWQVTSGIMLIINGLPRLALFLTCFPAHFFLCIMISNQWTVFLKYMYKVSLHFNFLRSFSWKSLRMKVGLSLLTFASHTDRACSSSS